MLNNKKHCPKTVFERKGKQNFNIDIGHNIFNIFFLILHDIIINASINDNNIIIKIPIKKKYNKERSFNKMITSK